jgi:hypothetical protein
MNIYLMFAFLAVSYTGTSANPINFPRSDTTPSVHCAYPAGGAHFSSNENLLPSINDWVKNSPEARPTDAYGFNATSTYAGDNGHNFTHIGLNDTYYYASHFHSEFSTTLVSTVKGYYVPLEGYKAAILLVLAACVDGGDNTVNITDHRTVGNCPTNMVGLY